MVQNCIHPIVLFWVCLNPRVSGKFVLGACLDSAFEVSMAELPRYVLEKKSFTHVVVLSIVWYALHFFFLAFGVFKTAL